MNKDDVLRFLMSALSSIQVADELIPELIAPLPELVVKTRFSIYSLCVLAFCKISVQSCPT